MDRTEKENEIIKVIGQLPLDKWIAKSSSSFEIRLDNITVSIIIMDDKSCLTIYSVYILTIENYETHKLGLKIQSNFDIVEMKRIAQQRKDDGFLLVYNQICHPDNPRKTHVPAQFTDTNPFNYE